MSPLALIGEEIGQARKRRCMTTFAVAQITRIPERYVQCIESGDFASLPGKSYVFGFTRTICALLDMDAEKCILVIKAELYGGCNGGPGITHRSLALIDAQPPQN